MGGWVDRDEGIERDVGSSEVIAARHAPSQRYFRPLSAAYCARYSPGAMCAFRRRRRRAFGTNPGADAAVAQARGTRGTQQVGAPLAAGVDHVERLAEMRGRRRPVQP